MIVFPHPVSSLRICLGHGRCVGWPGYTITTYKSLEIVLQMGSITCIKRIITSGKEWGFF